MWYPRADVLVEIDVVDGRGNERVGGRPRPGKVVTKMLVVLVAMVATCGI